MTAEEPVLHSVEDHVATVTINRPERMNALDAASNRRLHDVLVKLDADDDVWVLVLTGAGERAFCAGGDLVAADVDAPNAMSARRSVSFGGGLTGVAGRLLNLEKPIIAAVNGVAVGGGFELALACDIVVAADTARFVFPEARIGWISHSPCVHRAVRHLPFHIGMGLVLTGRSLSAEEAHRYGMLNELVTDGDVVGAATAWARSILECSPLAVRAVKEAAVVGLRGSLDTALSTRWETIEEFQHTRDRFEGTEAFREKRTPQWEAR